jgi:hypothetical protein
MRVLRLALLLAVVISSIPPSSVIAAVEFALVQKVMDDKAILVRSNGTTYLIEKGVGCLSLWRYEGKRVLIHSPGLFLGVGSKLLIPDADQECRIWSAEEIEAIPRRPAGALCPVQTSTPESRSSICMIPVDGRPPTSISRMASHFISGPGNLSRTSMATVWSDSTGSASDGTQTDSCMTRTATSSRPPRLRSKPRSRHQVLAVAKSSSPSRGSRSSSL